MPRLSVSKTWKLYSGGAFIRSESGRTYALTDAGGSFMANAARASRKDLRDAVSAARKGFTAWSQATPYNRGQVVYRIAEMLEARAADVVALLQQSHGMTARQASAEVTAAVDRLVHYAGWTDKLAAVFGGANPVSGPFFSYSAPEPTGVVGILAPAGAPLLGMVSCLAPAIAAGNAVVVLSPAEDACVAITLAEIVATSDVPSGVVNILTGDPAETALWLAEHRDVNALDLTGADPALRQRLEVAAAETLKRVHAPRSFDPSAEPGTARLRAFLEIKTVWHPVGAVSLAGGTAY